MFTVQEFPSKTLSWWNTQRKNIDFSPSYQRRGGIWSSEDKSFLIDSVINGYDIPKIYLANFAYLKTRLNEHNKLFAVIDGRQRLEAIFEFFDGKLQLADSFSYEKDKSLKLGGLAYRDLRTKYPEIAADFENFNLSVMSVITDEQGKINDLFVRLNRSKPLTGAEIRNAMQGVVPKLIRQIAAHKFFTTRVSFSTKRRQEYNAAAKILLIEFRGKFVDTKKTHLNRFVEEGLQSQTTSFKKAADAVIEVLDTMVQIFRPKDPLLASQGPIALYYWFTKNHSDEKAVIREFLVRFNEDRRENKQRADENRKADEELLQFELLSRSINDQGSLTTRYAILEKRFRKFVGA